jgi:hypothetical protein
LWIAGCNNAIHHGTKQGTLLPRAHERSRLYETACLACHGLDSFL